MKSQSLSHISRIGELFERLSNNPATARDVEEAIDELHDVLNKVSFPNTAATAEQLRTFQGEALRRYQSNGGLQNADRTALASIARTVLKAFHHEAQQMKAVLLDTSAVADSLRDLPDRLSFLTESQTHLRNEVIRCLETGAYRSGIVMTWNFGYDYVRHWVFSNHVGEFNKTLTTKYMTTRGGSQRPVYEPISQYSDFWEAKPAPGERTFLDTCEGANILNGKAYDSLVNFLRRRNDFAHPNFLTPDVDLTKGYIAELLSVITSPPFPKPSGT